VNEDVEMNEDGQINDTINDGDEDEVGIKNEEDGNLYVIADYHDLNVDSEVKALFSNITRYKSRYLELETFLKCFVPDYLPAIGQPESIISVVCIC
jgi:intraflagellar transport protein 46